jgi:polar amino acid transport system substrate-binding protein
MGGRSSFQQAIRALFTLILFFGLGGCGDQAKVGPRSGDSLQRVLQSGELKVGYAVVPPWIIKDPNTGKLSGSCIETIEEIARLAGLKLTLVEATWTTFVAGLQTGQYDLSIVPAYVTISRAKAMNFTRPVSYTGNTVVIRSEESRFLKLQDLDQPGVTIAVIQGTQDHEFALKTFTRAIVKAISSQDIPILFAEVSARRVDAALADTYNARNFVRQHPDVREMMPDKPYSILPAAWSVRYDDVALWQFINSALIYLEGNGVLQTLDRKYDVPNDKPF